MKDNYIKELDKKINDSKDKLEVAKEIFSSSFKDVKDELVDKYEMKIKTLEELKEKIQLN